MAEEHEYAWRWFGWHCMQAVEHARLRRCLFDPEWLGAKLEAVGVAPIVADCERLLAGQDRDKIAHREDNRPVELLADALRKSAHAREEARSPLARANTSEDGPPALDELPASAAGVDSLLDEESYRTRMLEIVADEPELAWVAPSR